MQSVEYTFTILEYSICCFVFHFLSLHIIISKGAQVEGISSLYN